jgi:hypothetical protein
LRFCSAFVHIWGLVTFTLTDCAPQLCVFNGRIDIDKNANTQNLILVRWFHSIFIEIVNGINSINAPQASHIHSKSCTPEYIALYTSIVVTGVLPERNWPNSSMYPLLPSIGSKPFWSVYKHNIITTYDVTRAVEGIKESLTSHPLDEQNYAPFLPKRCLRQLRPKLKTIRLNRLKNEIRGRVSVTVNGSLNSKQISELLLVDRNIHEPWPGLGFELSLLRIPGKAKGGPLTFPVKN